MAISRRLWRGMVCGQDVFIDASGRVIWFGIPHPLVTSYKYPMVSCDIITPPSSEVFELT